MEIIMQPTMEATMPHAERKSGKPTPQSPRALPPSVKEKVSPMAMAARIELT